MLLVRVLLSFYVWIRVHIGFPYLMMWLYEYVGTLAYGRVMC
jgi:hypothetical protein